ncbi:MAG TPA: hypothetical protein V6C99_12295 [Oculatellaceae cyanobacterium]
MLCAIHCTLLAVCQTLSLLLPLGASVYPLCLQGLEQLWLQKKV